MPQVGWKGRNGKTYTFEEAMTMAKKKGAFYSFPPAALRMMEKGRQERSVSRFSPSAAFACLRQRTLRPLIDYYLSPTDVWKMSRGTAVHDYLDEKIEGQSEMSLKMDLNFKDKEGGNHTVVMQGTLDYYEPETRTLYDYKTTRSFYYYMNGKNVMKDYPTPEHELQVNLYALLLKKHGKPVERAFLWYVAASDAVKLVPVELWPEKEVERIAHQLAAPILSVTEDGLLPPAIQPEDEDYWQCRFCPIEKECREFEKEGITHVSQLNREATPGDVSGDGTESTTVRTRPSTDADGEAVSLKNDSPDVEAG
jgi:CRISPR/Cas system-associated exonuclease Cas4 (RecB family)